MAASRQPSNENLQWPAYNSKSLGIDINDFSLPGLVDYTMCEFWDEINAILPSATYPSTSGRGNGTAAGPTTTSPATSIGSVMVISTSLLHFLVTGACIGASFFV